MRFCLSDSWRPALCPRRSENALLSVCPLVPCNPSLCLCPYGACRSDNATNDMGLVSHAYSSFDAARQAGLQVEDAGSEDEERELVLMRSQTTTPSQQLRR